MRHVCPECGDAGDPGTCAKDNVPRVPAGMDPLLGTQIGSWRVARLIGAGGMGRVYAGVQPSIGARVAIKVLKDAADAELVERFFNEARAVNLIRHEAIVDVIDLGKLPDGAPYIVMEFLEGAPLRTLIKHEPRPPTGAVARIVCDVLAALEAAHAKAIIHRDLKPDNIFISPAGRVTVLDFGIAKLAKEAGTPTRTGGVLGTPAYMSPEQARAQPLDARSDLYTLGVILYEATTGVLPFNAPSLYDLLDQHVKSTPTAPRAIDPAIPVAVDAVIMRALAKDPVDRFASAAEMRTTLAAAIEHLPKAELAIPNVGGAMRIPTSDPNAPTQASIAYDDTRASADVETRASGDLAVAFDETHARGDAGTMQGRGSRPLDRETGVRVSRALIALMAGSALLGLAAVIYVVLRTPDSPPDSPPAPPPVALPTPPPDLSKGPIEIPIANLNSFDPVAYYETALAKAEWAAGGPVQPTKVTWRHFDRAGKIDVTDPEGSADYFFVVKDPKDEFCFILVILEKGGARLSKASLSGSGSCGGGIRPPRCTIAQLWERAIADGAPADATHGNLNLLGRDWIFSVQGEKESHYVANDCQ